MKQGVLWFVGAIAVLGAAVAQAQFPPPDTYGTQDSVTLQIPAAAFTPMFYCYTSGVDGDGYSYVSTEHSCIGGSPLPVFWAPVNLPHGAWVNGLTLYYKDTDDTHDIRAEFVTNSGTTDPSQNVNAYVTSSGSSGWGVATNSSLGIGIDTANQYYIRIVEPSTSVDLRFKAVSLTYHLRVSPAPAAASFEDVPTSSPIFRFVEALKASGITAGCDATHFCPNANLTRGQMAVFLATALGLHWE